MIEYVVANNLDDRILARAKKLLEEGAILSFPTDTSWVLAVAPHVKSGVENLYRAKVGSDQKHLGLLCQNFTQISYYAEVSTDLYRIIRPYLPGPYTFIFKPTKNLPRYIRSYRKDGEIGIRIPDSLLCRSLLHYLDYPLLSTSITPSLVWDEYELKRMEENFQSTFIYSYLIEDRLGHFLSMILDPGEVEHIGLSSVINFSEDGVIEILREGAGDVTPFR